MDVFEYSDYKSLITDWVLTRPKKGYGQFKKMADHLGVHSVVISQIFKGDRDLTLEQACELTGFLGLNDLKKDYFLLLVQKQRAGTRELRETMDRQIRELRKKAAALQTRIKHESFSEKDQATFYSQWFYSAVRIATDLPEINSVEELAELLQLNRQKVAKTLEFLIHTGLVVERSGKLAVGPRVTHVGHDSPLVYRHHSNWRLRALQSMDNIDPEHEFYYTGPMALSLEAAEKIRQLLVQAIEDATKHASRSESEILACLNMDWFRL